MLLPLFQWLAKNINKNLEKSGLPCGIGFLGNFIVLFLLNYLGHLCFYWVSSILFASDSGSAGLMSHSVPSTKVVCPDTSQMVIYDPSQKLGTYNFSYKGCFHIFLDCNKIFEICCTNDYQKEYLNIIVILLTNEFCNTSFFG